MRSREMRPRRETTSAPACRDPTRLAVPKGFICRPQPPAELSEHVEEFCLTAIIDGALRHLELHDHVDGHVEFLPGATRALPQAALIFEIALPFMARSHRQL